MTATGRTLVIEDDPDGGQGLRALRQLRATDTGATVPFIVAYTGYHAWEADARDAGCDAFLVKPAREQGLRLLDAITRAEVETRQPRRRAVVLPFRRPSPPR